MENDTPKALGALQVNETKLMGHVHEVVRSSVEETLNALLDAEADEICGAQRYERSPDCVFRARKAIDSRQAGPWFRAMSVHCS